MNIEEYLDEISRIRREWAKGVLTLAEAESFLSTKAKEWLVQQQWISPEMDKEIESKLFRFSGAAQDRDRILVCIPCVQRAGLSPLFRGQLPTHGTCCLCHELYKSDHIVDANEKELTQIQERLDERTRKETAKGS